MSHVTASASELPQPLQTISSGLRRIPGVEQLNKITDGALDRIGAISPRGRRLAVYTGAGVLGFAGVVEWPLALAGAAVAWLTQPRPAVSVYDDTTSDSRARSVQGKAPRPHEPSTAAGTGPAPASAGTTMAQEHQGPGDRLAPSHFHHDRAEDHGHEQPAKVGDPATASALKRVARACADHADHDEKGASASAHGSAP
ncbi:hypothetical protein ACF08B_30100 [Streptomyces sp. NPDC015139]|uniref:hypothetical protein n=1 Tax=Streptomyces sp. NPDC015139 TaxID=3364942 RepID=UPI0036FAAA57